MFDNALRIFCVGLTHYLQRQNIQEKVVFWKKDKSLQRKNMRTQSLNRYIAMCVKNFIYYQLIMALVRVFRDKSFSARKVLRALEDDRNSTRKSSS